MGELQFLTVAEAARLIAARKLSLVKLTETFLARIEALDDQLDSFVTFTADRARRDGSRGRPLPSIPGGPPDVGRRPPGCSFAPRCGRCDEVMPLDVVAPAQRAACYHPIQEAVPT